MKHIALVFGLFSALTMAASLDPSKSSATWYGEKITGFHYGDIALKSGDIVVKGGQVSGGTVDVDMGSMTCGDCDASSAEKLIGHLKSDDFFSVATHQTATLKITQVTPWAKVDPKKAAELLSKLAVSNKREFTKVKVEGPTHLILADLNIKGQSNPQEIVAHVKVTGSKVEASSVMFVDRTRWNVRYGSAKFFDKIGNKAISDTFEVAVKLATK